MQEIDILMQQQETDKLYIMIENCIINAVTRVIESKDNYYGFLAIKAYQIQDVTEVFKTLPQNEQNRILESVVNPKIQEIHGNNFKVSFEPLGFVVENEKTGFKKYLTPAPNQ